MKQVVNLDKKECSLKNWMNEENVNLPPLSLNLLVMEDKVPFIAPFVSAYPPSEKVFQSWNKRMIFLQTASEKKEAAEKKTLENTETVEIFKSVIADYEAGLPTNSTVYWVGLYPSKICRKMQETVVDASYYIVSRLLKESGYRKRRYSKEQCFCNPENRDAQFNKIAALKRVFSEAGLPVLSIDTKQKEMLGNFDRGESYYGKDKRKVLDHDIQSYSSGMVIPNGIYDCFDNKGYITLGTSKDTSEFVCDNLLYYWQTELQWVYPDAESMLLLCDGGGSNACLHYIVKHDLCNLSKLLGMNILVAHYPPHIAPSGIP